MAIKKFKNIKNDEAQTALMKQMKNKKKEKPAREQIPNNLFN